MHQLLALDSHRLHFFDPSACTWEEAKADTEAHVRIVANDDRLIMKLTPDLETNSPVVFQLQV